MFPFETVFKHEHNVRSLSPPLVSFKKPKSPCRDSSGDSSHIRPMKKSMITNMKNLLAFSSPDVTPLTINIFPVSPTIHAKSPITKQSLLY